MPSLRMSCSSWPAEIHVSETVDGACFQLPRRTSPRLLAQAVLPVCLGLPLVVLGIVLLCDQSVRSIGMGVTVMGATLIVCGVGARFTNSKVDVRAGALIFTERIGLLTRPRRRPFELVRQFVVHRLREGDLIEPPPHGVIRIECHGAQDLWFAAGYPYEWLTRLAQELAHRTGSTMTEAPQGEPEVLIEPLFSGAIRDEDTFDRA